MTASYGIDTLAIYPATTMLDIAALCEARGSDFAQINRSLMTLERSVCPPWEDTVTLAVNAASAVVDPETRHEIGLLIVCTESSVDQEKPVSSWVHRWLGLSSGCRNFEVKHACYAGTAAMRVALSWLREQNRPETKALIVGADLSLLGFEEPYEPVMGACGFALMLAREPGFLEIDESRCGVYASEVTDVIRPALTVETGNSENSLFAYLEGLEGAYQDFRRRNPGLAADFDASFKKHIYHLPFAGMGLQAHRTLASIAMGLDRREATDQFAVKVEPSLRYSRRMGSSYSASTFIALLSMLDHAEDVGAGDDVSVFSFGSGSCAELYAARFGPHARSVARSADLARLLDARRPLTVATYEASEAARVAGIGVETFRPDTSLLGDWYGTAYEGTGRLVLDSIDLYRRRYRRA